MKTLWYITAAILGMVMGAALLGTWQNSWTFAAIGGAIGLPIGWGFARLVPFHEFLLHIFD